MPKKPRQRRAASTQAANDNTPGGKPSCYVWYVYRAAARARWIGQVAASMADEAIDAAAVEFRTDIKKLIAMRRWEVA